MKNIKLLFWSALFLIIACKKNEDITLTEEIPPIPVLINSVEMELQGRIFEPYSYFAWHQNIFSLHNVNVQLMFQGIVLDETNTDGTGRYFFPAQQVPVEGAYLKMTSPGYYPNILKVDTVQTNYVTRYLLRESFEPVNGEALSSGNDFIKIKGHLQNPTPVGGATFFITNANNELIGNYTSDGDLYFEFTTLANEPLFFHYDLNCSVSAPIPLGPFSEDTDVGTLLDQSYNLTFPRVDGDVSAVDCSNNDVEGYILIKRNGLTIFNQNPRGYYVNACFFENDPDAYITVVNTNPRSFGDQTVDYVGGQSIDHLVEVCTNDNTYFQYTLGGVDYNPELYTYLDILPSGLAMLKQIDPTPTSSNEFVSFEINSINTGSTSGTLRIFGFPGIKVGGDNLNLQITSNDGSFIEGTFSGEVFDPFESSLGEIAGSFRSRIH